MKAEFGELPDLAGDFAKLSRVRVDAREHVIGRREDARRGRAKQKQSESHQP